MNDLLPTIKDWRLGKLNFAIATVVKTWGSAPRKIGSMMIVNENGGFAGSVSGGCVESAVIQESLEIIGSNNTKLLEYGVSNDTAWDLGLACGGKIEIFCQAFTEDYSKISNVVENKQEISFSVNISKKSELSGTIKIDKIINPRIEKIITEDKIVWFHNHISSPQKLIIIGGVQIAQILSEIASSVGYYVIIVDPRKSFLSEARFPNIEIIKKWPEDAFEQLNLTSNTALVVLSHDPKIDDPALAIALESPCFYIGALGSKTTNNERRKRLGFIINNLESINKLKGPVGLDIGAKTPEEIAVSILAEIIKEANYRQ